MGATTSDHDSTAAVERVAAAYRYAFGEHRGQYPLPEMRTRLTEVLRRETPDISYTQERIDIDGVPAIRVRADREATEQSSEVVVWYHGGGYLLGSAEGNLGLAVSLSHAAGCDVVVPDYRLGPESPFPAAVDDAVAVARWAISTYGGSSTVLGGDSAGGGLTMAALLTLRDDGHELPAAAMLASPLVDLTATAASIESNSHTELVITAASLTAMSRGYLQGHPPEDPRASPVFADLGSLPPVLIQAADDEALLDDATTLSSRLREAGTDCELTIVDGVCHAWQLFPVTMPKARSAIDEMAEFVRARTATSSRHTP